MNILLDTHVWVWSQECPESIGKQANEIICKPETNIYISTVSTLEIARLIAGGLITLKGDLEEWVQRSIHFLHAKNVGLSHKIAIASYELPGEFHKDPADRMLVATAMTNQFALITADERILAYPHVKTIDARR